MNKITKISFIVLAISVVIIIGLVALINSGNPLTGAKIEAQPSYSGSGEVIGEYGLVTVSSKDFDKITPEYYAEFAKDAVDGSGYDYVTVASKDGRGTIWYGSDISTLNIGTLAEDNTISEITKTMTLDGDTYK